MAKKITGNTSENIADGKGDVMLGSLSGTAATDGFFYIPSCAGAPTGTPTARTGYSVLCFDSTNGRLYTWNGSAWKYAAVTT